MRKRRKTKGITLTGRRIPVELNRMAVRLKQEANAVGRKMSLQDAFRQIVQEWKRRK